MDNVSAAFLEVVVKNPQNLRQKIVRLCVEKSALFPGTVWRD
jgi:hypothetical protein